MSAPSDSRAERLQAEVERLREAAEASSRYLTGLVHELRTPLGSILILAELMEQDPQGRLAPEDAARAAKIHRAARDMRSLLVDVAELSKLESGRLEPAWGTVSLGELLAAVAEESGAAARDAGVEVRTELDRHLPATLRSDALRLRQLVDRLTGAAVAAAEDHVVLRARPTAEGVRIEIADDAPPLSTEERQALFEPLLKVDRRSRRGDGGSGLTLPIARQLARLLGGRLELAPGASRGNTFVLELPRTAGG